MPRGVFLDAVGAKWRINRDRNCTREKNSRVRHEEGPRSRQHQRHASAGRYATARQLRGAAVPGGVELAKGERKAVFPGFAIFGDDEVRTLGVMCSAISQHID